MLRASFFGVFLFLLFVPVPSLAYVTVSIGATPQYQVPNQPVVLKARAAVTKGTYTYAWSLNGAPLTEGVDLDSVTVAAGSQGTETNVDVILVDADGNVAGGDTYIIRTGSVDVVWEGQTYVPPFFRGKAYPNGESRIILQAIPHLSQDGAEIPANELVYAWNIDGNTPSSLSGYGKSAVSISPTAFRNTTTVAVTVSTRNGAYAVKGTVQIPIVSPRIVIYEDKPLSGLWLQRTAGDSITFSGDEMTFWAVPFFVTDPTTLTYSWTLNGSPFPLNKTDPSVATFRKTGGGTGLFPVGVNVQNPAGIFEKAAKTFTLSF